MALRPNSELWNYFTNIVEEGMAECKLCKQRLRNNRSYNLKLHLRKIHRNRSEVNKHFDINVLENVAVCKTCNQRLKNRLCNLRLHMRRNHNIEIKIPEDKFTTYELLPQQPYDEDKIQAVLKVAKRKMIEEVGNDEKRPTRHLSIKMDKRAIVRAVIGLVVEDGVSPHLFKSKHIAALLHPICEAISDKEGKEFKVNEAEIERIISLMANYIRNDFSNDLHCRLLSIKIDTDVNAPTNTYCISAQFINEGEIEQRILGIIGLKNDDQLKEDHIKQILYKFNIDSNQIISAFWDNTKHKHNKQVSNSEYLKELEQFQTYPDISLGDIKIEPYLGIFAQLCLLDIFRNSKIYQLFLECRNLAMYISNELNGYCELFDINNLSIPHLDSPWKAGSTYKMMNDLYEARNYLKNVKFEKFENPEDQFSSSQDLLPFIEAFCKSTTYLQKSIQKYHNEELHTGDFYAQWLKCKLLTEKLLLVTDKTNDHLSMILTEALTAIENRTKELLENERLTACLYLDPRFQRILNSDQKSGAVEYLKMLWRRAKLYIVDETEFNETTLLFDDDEDAFLNEFLSHDIEVTDNKSSDVFKKIEGLKLAFQMVDTNILSYWRGQKINDPEVHMLSTICFAIPATEIYNKMNYCRVYQLDADSELSTFTKENLLNLRVNAHLLDDGLANIQLTTDDRSKASSTLSDSEEECYDISEDDSINSSTVMAYSELPQSSATLKINLSSVVTK